MKADSEWKSLPFFTEVTGGWRTLLNVESHSLYSSPSIIRMIKSRRMSWVKRIARMGRIIMHVGYW
jgi:hypothetical protein